MIDPDIIEGIKDPQLKYEIKMALHLLVDSGVIQEQQTRLLTQVATGAEQEEESALVARIRQFRTKHTLLESLKQLGLKYKDIENEHPAIQS